MTTDAATGSSARPRLVERYRRFLPITDATPALTLGEGFTPLVAAPRLGARIGLPNLRLKLEGLNPTGSFKDRGMVVAVSKAMEAGATSIICASIRRTGFNVIIGSWKIIATRLPRMRRKPSGDSARM